MSLVLNWTPEIRQGKRIDFANSPTTTVESVIQVDGGAVATAMCMSGLNGGPVISDSRDTD